MNFNSFLRYQIILIIICLIVSLAYNVKLYKMFLESNEILTTCLNKQSQFKDDNVSSEVVGDFINQTIEKDLK